MYHTSCRAMVNGRRYGDFLTHDLIKIEDLMEGNSDLKEINNRIRSACQMYFAEGASSPRDNGARNGSKGKLMNGPSTREPICDGGDLMLGRDGTCRMERNFISGGGLAVEGRSATDCQSSERVSTCLHCDEVCGQRVGPGRVRTLFIVTHARHGCTGRVRDSEIRRVVHEAIRI